MMPDEDWEPAALLAVLNGTLPLWHRPWFHTEPATVVEVKGEPAFVIPFTCRPRPGRRYAWHVPAEVDEVIRANDDPAGWASVLAVNLVELVETEADRFPANPAAPAYNGILCLA